MNIFFCNFHKSLFIFDFLTVCCDLFAWISPILSPWGSLSLWICRLYLPFSVSFFIIIYSLLSLLIYWDNKSEKYHGASWWSTHLRSRLPLPWLRPDNPNWVTQIFFPLPVWAVLSHPSDPPAPFHHAAHTWFFIVASVSLLMLSDDVIVIFLLTLRQDFL